MRKIFKFILLVFAGALLVSSCSSEEDKTENLKHSTDYNMLSSIENLAVVGSIDLLQIIEKSGFETNPNLPIEASAMYKMMVKEKLDADKTGIDLSGNNHFAVSISNPEEPEFVVYCAKITNPENAKHTIQDLFKGAYAKEDIDGDEYHFVVEDEVAVGWDSKDIVVVLSEKNDPKSVVKDLLKARFVDGPDDDKGMEAYLKQTDDMNIYVQIGNTKDFLQAQNADFPAEMLSSLEDAYYIGTGNFNKGEIVFDWNIHAEEIKNSEFNALAAEAINESFYNFLTADNLIAFGTASINMDAIFHALEFAQNKDFSFEKIEEQTGISKEMMEKMFSGEFAISFVDINTIDYSSTMDVQTSDDDFFAESYSYSEEIPVVIFTAGISDSTQFGELLRLSGSAKTMNGVYQMDEDAFIAFHKDKLILTTDQPIAAHFASGQSFPTYMVPGGKNSDKPLFGFLNTDPNKMPAGLMKMTASEEGEMAVSFMSLFESVLFEGEFEKMEFKAVMNNKSDNALKVITDYVISMIKEKQMI